MNQKQKRKLIGVVSVVVILSIATGLIMYALKQNINLFYTPTELQQAETQADQQIRIGGYVKKHSVHYDANGQSVSFIVTDRTTDLDVIFRGVLPSLFREGQTVVATGKLNTQHIFCADEVLAKHDERYMPKPLAKKLKAEGIRS